jgi:sugar/nucleoside kinase (ribokinase family)
MTGSDGRPELDLLGIGNAIVDILAHTEEAVLDAEGLPKGSMTLIDAARADAIYGRMGPGVEVSGGSVANSVVGAASLGSRAAYVGKVRDDEFGRVFAHDIRAAGVRFETPPATGGAPTARCLILVTPDAHRTMSTYLGACVELGPEDIDEDLVGRAAVTYLEGYLWDPPRAKEAFRVAMAAARGAGRRVALTLSDAFCVDRYRAEFLALMRTATVDIVFANEHELHSLYQTADLDSAVNALREDVRLGVVTRSEKGCLVVTREETVAIQAYPVERLVDATGAGDLFEAGFLVGSARGSDHRSAARLGALVASEVIQHMGARPEVSLRTLAEQNGFEL